MSGDSQPSTTALTKREQEVLELMALGLANKEIAQRLSLSPRTVEAHVDHILGKLKTTSRTRAVIAASQAGLLGDVKAGETEQASSVSPQLRSQRLVGRRQELAGLDDRLESATRGHGSLLTIGGEAGSGKSRLITEFGNRVAATRAHFAVGQCFEYARSPLAPFLSALATLSAANPNVRLPFNRLSLNGPARTAVNARAGSGFSTDEPGKLDQFNALAESFIRLGAVRPALIVLEDAHWADSASLDFLLHISPLLDSSRLMLVVTHRTEELTRNHPLRRVLAKLGRYKTVTRTALEPLSSAEINSLLSDVLGDQQPPSAAALHTICVQSEGNPLFAEELLKAVLETGPDANRVPATLREAVLERLNALQTNDRAILVHASAIGRRFDAQLLAHIVESSIAVTLGALKQAIDLQLIVEQDGDVVLFAFKHELTRQAIYGELLVAQARPLHQRVAVALERDASGEHTAELAYHYWFAHEPAKATWYNELAGDNASTLFAFREAIVNYERAIDAGVNDPMHRALLQRKLAKALLNAGFGERSKQVDEGVLAFYEDAGERKRAAAVCLDLARTTILLGDTPQHEHYVKRALQLIENDNTDPAFFDAHLMLMSYFARWRWDAEQALKHATIALSARCARAPTFEIRFYEMRMIVHSGLGRTAEALADAKLAAALAETSGNWSSVLRVWSNYTEVMGQHGERAYAIDGCALALRTIQEQHLAGLTAAWSLIALALVRATHGDLRGAAELIEQAGTEVIETPSFRLSLARVAIPLGIALDDEALIRRTAQRELVEIALRSSNVEIMSGRLSAFAELDFFRGRRREGMELLGRALDGLDAIDARPPPGDIEELLLLVAQRSDVDDVARARKFMKRIAASSSVRATAPYSALFEAYEQLRFGDHARGAQRAIAAAELFHEIGWPLHEARALEAAGRRRQALEIFKQAGAVRDTRRIEAALLSRRDHEQPEMTPREREIHDLLLQGNSNKAIAEKLHLSERTVSSHISAIFAKLGVASRAELVARSLAPARSVQEGLS